MTDAQVIVVAPAQDAVVAARQDGAISVATSGPQGGTVAISTSGPQGAPGPPGPTGAAGDGGFTFTQASPAATWTITNTLGRYPSSVLIVIGTEMVDADVNFPSLSQIVVVFATPQSGRVEIL